MLTPRLVTVALSSCVLLSGCASNPPFPMTLGPGSLSINSTWGEDVRTGVRSTLPDLPHRTPKVRGADEKTRAFMRGEWPTNEKPDRHEFKIDKEWRPSPSEVEQMERESRIYGRPEDYDARGDADGAPERPLPAKERPDDSIRDVPIHEDLGEDMSLIKQKLCWIYDPSVGPFWITGPCR